MAQGEGHDALLQPRRDLVGQAGLTARTGAEDLQAMALDEGLPAVIARAVVAELAAGAADTDFLGAGEETDAVAEDQVIIGHEGGPPLKWFEAPREWVAFVCPASSRLSRRLVGSAR